MCCCSFFPFCFTVVSHQCLLLQWLAEHRAGSSWKTSEVCLFIKHSCKIKAAIAAVHACSGIGGQSHLSDSSLSVRQGSCNWRGQGNSMHMVHIVKRCWKLCRFSTEFAGKDFGSCLGTVFQLCMVTMIFVLFTCSHALLFTQIYLCLTKIFHWIC